MSDGTFVYSDNTGSASTELTSLFGVAQGVGDTPVQLAAGTPGHMGQGLSRDPQGGTVGGTPAQSTTVTHALQGFYGMDKAALTSLQKQLYLGGFYSRNFYTNGGRLPQFGAADDDSFAAFKSAVVQAARSGKVLPQVINDSIQSVAAGGGPVDPAKVPPTRLTSPDDIRAAVVAEARQQYGHKADESLVNDIISRYQALQAQAQESTAPTVTQAPDLSTYVDRRLQSADPTAVGLNSSLHAANLVMQAFGASAGNAPTGGTGG